MTDNTDELCHVTETSFHGVLGSDDYPYEAGRYWLFTAKLCPFAHRTELTRTLRGLDDKIGLTIASGPQTEAGWHIGAPYDQPNAAPSPINITRLPQLYELAQPGYAGRVSVPVLFDLKTQTIVNNESAEIVRMLDSFPGADGPVGPLYPENQRETIDALCDELEEGLFAPIYRAGFARDQETHDRNSDSVFKTLERMDKTLARQPFLLGDKPSQADVHSFAHLVRFDNTYHGLYRLNRCFLGEYDNLPGYMQRMADLPGVGQSVDIDAIKEGYFLSWNQPTTGAFVPHGPVVDPKAGTRKAA